MHVDWCGVVPSVEPDIEFGNQRCSNSGTIGHTNPTALGGTIGHTNPVALGLMAGSKSWVCCSMYLVKRWCMSG